MVKLSTIVNAFKASGIYPVDRNAINPKKLKPSEVYCGSSSGGKSNSGDNSNTSANNSNNADNRSSTNSLLNPGTGKRRSYLALKALEDEMNSETIQTFTRRFEEGYDLTSNVVYST